MLILSRNVGQRLMINENITITVIGVTGAQISLGIEAPKHIPIHREEIFQKIQSRIKRCVNRI